MSKGGRESELKRKDNKTECGSEGSVECRRNGRREGEREGRRGGGR